MILKNKTPLLIIEDDPADLQWIISGLQEAGIKFEIHHCGTLYEGLAFLQLTPVELVLLDLNLPDSAGFKTVSSFVEKAPNVPFLVISAINNDIIGMQSVKAGAQDFLVKGQADARQLCRSVRFSLQRSKVQLQLEETARELEKNKKRFLEVQQMAHFGAWEMDIVSNAMNWSDEVFRIFAIIPGSFQPLFSDYIGFVPPDERILVETFFENVAKDGQMHEMEHRILVEGSNIRYVHMRARIQIEEMGRKVILAGSIQDVSDRRHKERLLFEKNMSNKSAKIQEEVLSDLSFQIRTPLFSIVNLLFLLENNEVVSQYKPLVGDLKTSVHDLSISVNNLLNFSIIVSDHVRVEDEEFNLGEILKGTEKIIKIKANASGQHIAFSTDEKIPEKIIGDPRKLMQILYNLLDQSIRYGETGSRIQVSVTMGEAQGIQSVLQFRIEMQDVALSAASLRSFREAEKLLLNNPEDGLTGNDLYGIAIVSKLSRILKGSFEIASTPAAGTAISISVPVKMARYTRFVQGERPDGPLKILLVEDHFLNQIATKKVLRSWSEFVTVDIAENGLVGVEKFKEYGYDLVLMDLQMPVMNGMDATRKIRETSTVPIIALTASSSRQEQEGCLAAGMNDYLVKPFKPEELYARIMAIMSLVMN